MSITINLTYNRMIELFVKQCHGNRERSINHKDQKGGKNEKTPDFSTDRIFRCRFSGR